MTLVDIQAGGASVEPDQRAVEPEFPRGLNQPPPCFGLVLQGFRGVLGRQLPEGVGDSNALGTLALVGEEALGQGPRIEIVKSIEHVVEPQPDGGVPELIL
jgi:hypothetical protein